MRDVELKHVDSFCLRNPINHMRDVERNAENQLKYALPINHMRDVELNNIINKSSFINHLKK